MTLTEKTPALLLHLWSHGIRLIFKGCNLVVKDVYFRMGRVLRSRCTLALSSGSRLLLSSRFLQLGLKRLIIGIHKSLSCS